VVPGGERLVGGFGSRSGLVREHSDDGVQCTVARFDAREVGLEHLTARHLLAADPIREFQCTELPQLCHGPIMAHT
jgi:hypothetical protein